MIIVLILIDSFSMSYPSISSNGQKYVSHLYCDSICEGNCIHCMFKYLSLYGMLDNRLGSINENCACELILEWHKQFK